MHAATGAPLAQEALRRIAAVYAIEAEIRGQPPESRQAARTAQSAPLFAEMKNWLDHTLGAERAIAFQNRANKLLR